jgi:hypothetical protein
MSLDEPQSTGGVNDENPPPADSYAAYLNQFAEMSEEARMKFDPYHQLYEIARRRIGDLATRTGLDSGEMTTRYDHWLFDSAPSTLFVLDASATESTNSLGRVAHRYERWSRSADLALRLIF